jgi:methionine-rich copper-binding protein CopC
VSPRIRIRRLFAALAVALALVAVVPAIALAHAELVSSDPADGSTLSEPPLLIVLTFSQDVVGNSSIKLIGPDGSELASAGPDSAEPTTIRLVSPELPTLAPGAYRIDWQSIADDGDLLRGQIHFTVAQPSPSPSPTPSPTGLPSPTSSAGPSAAPSPNPSPSGGAASSGSGLDILLPLVVGVAVVIGLGYVLLRNRGTGGTSTP